MKDKIRCVRIVDGQECGQIKNHTSHGGSGYTHDWLKPEVRKERAPMSPIGAATERFNASEDGIEYRARVIAERGAPCPVRAPGCTGKVEHLHEKLSRGRAGGIQAAVRDGPPPVGMCDNCNDHISRYPRWAKENGWLLSRKDLAK